MDAGDVGARWARAIGLKAALCGRCVSSERVDNDLELATDLDDAVLYKDKKLKDQVEVAIGDGMEFTIPGNDICPNIHHTQNGSSQRTLTDNKVKDNLNGFPGDNKYKKGKILMNNINAAITDNHRDNRLDCELNHHGYPIQVKLSTLKFDKYIIRLIE